jgi:hypothetical protein
VAGQKIVVAVDYIESAPITITEPGIHLVLEGTGSVLQFVLGPDVADLYLAGTRDANVTGNALGNIIVGNDGRNVIAGLDGNDKLLGRGGDDDLSGGAGNDWLDGGEGWDIAQGGSGNDRLLAHDGPGPSSSPRSADLLSGGSGNDLLIVATQVASKVQLMGGSGQDLYRFMSLESPDAPTPGGSPQTGTTAGTAAGAAVTPKLELDAFIADLTAGDAIDMAGWSKPGAGSTRVPVTGLAADAPVAGETSIMLGGAATASNPGLKAAGWIMDVDNHPAFGGPDAPMSEVSGKIVVAYAAQVAIDAAMGRAGDASFVAAHQSPADMLNELLPLYQPTPAVP